MLMYVYSQSRKREVEGDGRKRRVKVRLGVQRMVWLAGKHSITFVSQRKVTPAVSYVMHSYTLNWALRETEKRHGHSFELNAATSLH